MTLKNISANMQIILDFDIPTLIECFKASGIIINESDINISQHSTNINKKPKTMLLITNDIIVIDSDFLDFKYFTKQKTISCDMLLANFRTEKLKKLIQ